MRITIPHNELEFTFARGTGKGGQKRNKTSTKAILDFDVSGSRALTDDQKAIVLRDSHRITADGHIIIACDAQREQSKNKRQAHAILEEHLSGLLTPRKVRRPTKKSISVKRKEREAKQQRKRKKSERRYRYE